ncbi:MAG: vitamin B12 dependent-methionine synthase activation domain-containing protein [Rikenellaceae bacterium]
MVDTLKIVDEAVACQADVICLSGLITPSLDEMIRVAQECEKRGLDIPILLGGATTSPIHTAVKIAPHYSGVVIHANNASDNPKILSQLMGEQRQQYIDEVKAQQSQICAEYERAIKMRKLISLDSARGAAKVNSEIIEPAHTGRLVFTDFDISDVEELIDWNFFFMAWGLKGHYPEILEDAKYGAEATKLFNDGQEILKAMKKSRKLILEGSIAIFPAHSEGDDIVVTTPKNKEVRLPMLRNQTAGEQNRSLTDLVAPSGDHIGCFALSAGVGLEKITAEYKAQGDDYSAMVAKLIADRLCEAFAQRVHDFVRREMWGFQGSEVLSARDIMRDKYQGVRVAFGYPACPDHSLKREVFDMLSVEMTTHMTLSENYMISPAESLCGLIFPRGEYFSVGTIDDEQLEDYAKRRGVTTDEAKRLIPNNI